MSMADLETAFEMIEAASDRCFFAGPKAPALVDAAEAALGRRLPPTYRAFVERFGAGDVDGEEIYGVLHDDFRDSGVPDAIWMTLEARDQWPLPEHLVVIAFDGGTGYYVLVTADDATTEGEVLHWTPGLTSTDDPPTQIAPDFGSFLLDTVRGATAS